MLVCIFSNLKLFHLTQVTCVIIPLLCIGSLPSPGCTNKGTGAPQTPTIGGEALHNIWNSLFLAMEASVYDQD